MEKTTLLGMARGAIQELVDFEMGRVVANILDPNTDPTAKRSITVTLDIKPDAQRQQLSLNASAKTKLAIAQPVSTSLAITTDRNGEVSVVELVPQVPGQTSLSGTEQEEPKILSFVNRG